MGSSPILGTSTAMYSQPTHLPRVVRAGAWVLFRKGYGEWCVARLDDGPDPTAGWRVLPGWPRPVAFLYGTDDRVPDMLLAAMPKEVPGEVAAELVSKLRRQPPSASS